MGTARNVANSPREKLMGSQGQHVVVVGTGRMARVRVPRLIAAGVEVTLTGRDPKRTELVAADLGVRSGPRDALVTKSFDAVMVTSASEDHHADLSAFLGTAPVLFCEKPVAATMEQARALQSSVERMGAEVYVGFQRRFDPDVASLQQRVVRGELGDLLHVRASNFDHRPSAREFIAKSGGMFRDLLIHDLDWLAWTTGTQIDFVHAFGSVRSCEDYRDFNDCDVAAVTVVMSDGVLGTLNSTRIHPSGQDVRMEVLGSQASASVGLTSRTPLQAQESDTHIGTQQPPADFMERFATAFQLETDEFARYVSGEAERFGGCTLDEAVLALAAAEACQASWAGSTRVSVSDFL